MTQKDLSSLIEVVESQQDRRSTKEELEEEQEHVKQIYANKTVMKQLRYLEPMILGAILLDDGCLMAWIVGIWMGGANLGMEAVRRQQEVGQLERMFNAPDDPKKGGRK